MHSTRPRTHRLRFSSLQPAAPRLPVTDHRDTLANRRPEAELMRAVLADALGCFQKGVVHQGRRVQRLAREAEEWLFNDDSRWPFSFVSICAVLGLEPEYIRRGLKRWGQGRPPRAPKKRSHMVEGQRRLAA